MSEPKFNQFPDRGITDKQRAEWAERDRKNDEASLWLDTQLAELKVSDTIIDACTAFVCHRTIGHPAGSRSIVPSGLQHLVEELEGKEPMERARRVVEEVKVQIKNHTGFYEGVDIIL